MFEEGLCRVPEPYLTTLRKFIAEERFRYFLESNDIDQ
jgi:hypothetical protein